MRFESLGRILKSVVLEHQRLSAVSLVEIKELLIQVLKRAMTGGLCLMWTLRRLRDYVSRFLVNVGPVILLSIVIYKAIALVINQETEE